MIKLNEEDMLKADSSLTKNWLLLSWYSLYALHMLTHFKIMRYAEECMGFPGGTVVKTPPANPGDAGSIRG